MASMKPNTRQSRPKSRSNDRNRYLSGSRLRSQLRQPAADDQSGGAAGDREHQALGEQLPDDANASGAEREPGRDLLAAGGGPRQEQPGDVGAGNQQHDADGGERQVGETPQRRLHFDIAAQTGSTPTPAWALVSGYARSSRAAIAANSRARLFERGARLEPPEHLEP